MKKIFTLFIAILCLGASIVKAETVTCYIDKYNYDTAAYETAFQDFTAELTVDENGVYTLTDFFNSGCPVTWTLSPTSGEEYDSMTFTDKCYTLDNGAKWFYDFTNDKDAVCKGFVEGNSETPTTFPYTILEEEGYSFNEASQKEGYKYYASICVLSYKEDNTYEYYYIGFYHNVAPSSGISDVAVDENAPVEYYNLQGLRVDNPTNGLYIRRQGNNTTKVFVK